MSAPSRVVLVTRVGSATGSKAAAASLACAASEPDRAALLVDLDGGRAPRPSLIASAGARALEERLAAHLPDVPVASRGGFCQVTLAADPAGLRIVPTALPAVREAVAVVHLSPRLLRAALDEPCIEASGALLRADLAADRALTALVAADLIRQHGLRVAVLGRPPGWFAARAALLGALPARTATLPPRLTKRLLRPLGLDLPTERPRARCRRP